MFVKRITRGVGIVAATAVLGSVAAAPSAQATFPGQDGRIATTVNTFTCFGIYGCWFPNMRVDTMDPDGSNRSEQGRRPKTARWPAYSPDGSQLVIAKADKELAGFPLGRGEYYGETTILTGASNGPVRDLVRSRKPGQYFATLTAGRADWTPDGRLLIVGKGADTGNPADAGGPVWIRENNRQLKTVWPGEATDASMSPDGQTIAIVNKDGLRFVNADGTNQRQRSLTARGRLETVDWAPDGRRLVLGYGESPAQPDGALVVITAAGGPETVLPQTGASPAWSPSGRFLVFTRGRYLLVSNPDGSNERTVRTYNAGGYPYGGPSEYPYGVSWQPRR